MKEPIIAGVDALRNNPLRSALSTLGVVVGVASLVAILTITDGLESFSREQIERTTDLQNLTITPVTTDNIGGIRIRRPAPVEFMPDDIGQLRLALHDRAGATLVRSGSAWVGTPGDTVRTAVLVTGALSGVEELQEVRRLAGRFLTPDDVRRQARVCVLSEAARRGLFPHDSSVQVVGRTVETASVRLTIVGVAANTQGETVPRLLVPFGVDTAVLGEATSADRPATILVRVRRVEDGEDVRRIAEQWLNDRYGAVQNAFTVVSSRERIRQAGQAMFVFKLTMGAIAGISLFVGGIGIMNILLASVAERTREIGIRRATGARAREILTQFLAESVAVSGAGSVLGVVVGYAGSLLVAAFIRMQTGAPFYASFNLMAVGVAVVAACAVGLVFGIYPARRASKLSPSDAIRHE